ncbi:NACHT domain-containing protein [Streptomyces sp. NPDC059037]|uniref:NACHT domain-containing protein n=1 Tax=Streptomyces sp. NPDC059037 TaxID=3346710 RepID=UPI0036BA917A
MEPTATSIGIKLASSVVAPLVKRLFATEGPGADLTDRPVRISALVSFRGQQRTLGERDLRRLATKLVKRAVHSDERPIPVDEDQAVVEALVVALRSLGDLNLTDVEAVQLGHSAFTDKLSHGDAQRRAVAQLSSDATYFYENLLSIASLHILDFFTRRSAFIPRTLVEQSRTLSVLVAKMDTLIARVPPPVAGDETFERDYLAYIAKKHGKLTIHGLDLVDPADNKWPLDTTYMRLEVAQPVRRTRRPRKAASPERSSALAEFGVRTPSDKPSSSVSRPADVVLADQEHVLLRGEAGSGKTTLVQWLALSAARPEPESQMAYLSDRIPFVLPLRTLTRAEDPRHLPTPRSFLSAVGCPLDGSQPDRWEHRVLRAGRGLILVDGIDEVPQRERPATREWLHDLVEAYEGNRWLVTSRPEDVDEDWLADDGFTSVVLSRMTPSDVEAFIRRWHGAARTGDAEKDAQLARYESQLIDAVRTKPDLARLVTNPLMCGLTCALNRDRDGYLPGGRMELYRTALQALLIRRDPQRRVRTVQLSEEAQVKIVQHLAYWLIRNGRNEMDHSRAEKIIKALMPAIPEFGEKLGDASAVFAHFLSRSGLLREPVPGTVDFVHRTFQDYLGAQAAVDSGDFGLLLDHAVDTQWEDVIRMAVGHAHVHERAMLIKGLLDKAPSGRQKSHVATRHRIYLLALACLDNAPDLDPRVRREVTRKAATLIPPRNESRARALAAVGPIVLDQLPGPEGLDDETAMLVVITASHVDSEYAIPVLARFATHPSPAVRTLLAEAWDRHATSRYADEIIAKLAADVSITVTSDEQLDALGSLGSFTSLTAAGQGVTDRALLRYALRTAAPQELRILGIDHLQSLAFLDAFTGSVKHLVVQMSAQVSDAGAIARHGLQKLVLTGTRVTDFGFLHELEDLEQCVIDWDFNLKPAWWDFNLMPGSQSYDVHLSPFSPMPLDDVGYGLLPSYDPAYTIFDPPPWGLRSHDAPWVALAERPRLTDLSLSVRSFASLPSTVAFPTVRNLFIESRTPENLLRDLSALPGMFPALVELSVGHLHPEADLTPLRALPTLRKVAAWGPFKVSKWREYLPPEVDLEHRDR